MPGVKKLYWYMLRNFLPLFLMTFGICWFLVLMQFLWKYIEDLVGKGLQPHILGELFYYAALNLIPLALPLAILLASLMTFGNMGENFELLAVKAAGVSLIKSMRPVIIFLLAVIVGEFFFLNYAIPKINVKFATLLQSVKMKSPELDIPEGSFYNEIEGYNLYVKRKDKITGRLYDVVIYDTSKGFRNMAVIVADSARMQTSTTKDYLLLTLFDGQQFANFNQSAKRSMSAANKFVPYARENFKTKEIIISFDSNFTRIDESTAQGSQISKNIFELDHSIDSLQHNVDSMNLANRAYVTQTAYLSYRSAEKKSPQEPKERQINAPVVPASPAARYEGPPVLDIDSVLKSIPASQRRSLYANAIAQSENTKTDLVIRSGESIMTQNNMRRHQAEYYRKFTLPFTCLVFFFIGAPLGAIIRRGGLGFPVVVSFLLFIVYYIIDNVGYKLARDGVWIAWHGVCLSSFVLFPLGVFITYKANKDSALLNADAYRKLLRRFLQTPAMQTASFYYNKYLHKYIIAPVKTLFKKKQR